MTYTQKTYNKINSYEIYNGTKFIKRGPSANTLYFSENTESWEPCSSYAKRRRLKILIVDDDVDVAKLLKQIIEIRDHEVDIVDDGLENLKANLKGVNFYNNKSANVYGISKELVEKYKGKVPGTMEELVELPGVGRKSASVVLGNFFGKDIIRNEIVYLILFFFDDFFFYSLINIDFSFFEYINRSAIFSCVCIGYGSPNIRLNKKGA